MRSATSAGRRSRKARRRARATGSSSSRSTPRRRLHYDLRLAHDGVLLSWAVTRGPSRDPADKRLAVRTEDHPLDYADVRGHDPQGRVRRRHRDALGPRRLSRRGRCRARAIEEGKLKFRLDGERLNGGLALVRMRPGKREARELAADQGARRAGERGVDARRARRPASPRAARWTRSRRGRRAGRFREEGFGEERTATRRRRRTGPRRRSPRRAEPPRLRLRRSSRPSSRRRPPARTGCTRSSSTATGCSPPSTARRCGSTPAPGSTGREKFRRHRAGPRRARSPDAVLLDGEVTAAAKGGRSDFSALQRALKEGRGALAYFVFDLLDRDGEDLPQPAADASARSGSKGCLGGGERSRPLQRPYPRAAAIASRRAPAGWASRASSPSAPMRPTAPRRSPRLAQDQVRQAPGIRHRRLLALRPRSAPSPRCSLGLYEDDALHYAGRVGTGFDDAHPRRSRRRACRRAPARPRPSRRCPRGCGAPREMVRAGARRRDQASPR